MKSLSTLTLTVLVAICLPAAAGAAGALDRLPKRERAELMKRARIQLATQICEKDGKLVRWLLEKTGAPMFSNYKCVTRPRILPVGVYLTRGGNVAATSRAKLRRAVDLVAQGDRVAFALLVKRDPGVFILNDGVEVQVTETAGLLASTVRVRIRGEFRTFWTHRDSLKQGW